MRIFVLGDLHLPWVDWKALKAASEHCRKYRPDRIVQVGDFTDQHNWGRWAKYSDSPSPDQEWEMIESSVTRMRGMFPSKIPWTITLGNHDRRYMMRAWDVGLPRHVIKTLDEMFPFDNWEWWVEQRPIEFDGVRYSHGDETTMTALKNPSKLSGNVVHGHLHRDAGIYTKSFWDMNVFSMNVGTLQDRETLAGRYMQKNFSGGWIGWGTVTDGIPALHWYHHPLGTPGAPKGKPRRRRPAYPHQRPKKRNSSKARAKARKRAVEKAQKHSPRRRADGRFCS